MRLKILIGKENFEYNNQRIYVLTLHFLSEKIMRVVYLSNPKNLRIT